MNSDDIPFRLAREIVPEPSRPHRIRWMKFAFYAAPWLALFGISILVPGLIFALHFIAGQEWMLKWETPLVSLIMTLVVTLILAAIIAMVKLPKAIDRELRRRLPSVKLAELLHLQPILFLRCFRDDELVSTGDTFGSLAARNRIEERIVTAAERMAPVVALGRPSEDLPHAGAHRFYVVDEDWQAAVGFLLSRCRYAIVVYHAGPNVQWEVRQAFEIVPLERLIFILAMPKRGFRFMQRLTRDGRDYLQRLSHASDTFRHYTGHPLPDLSQSTEIVVFKNGAPVFLDRRHSAASRRFVWLYATLVLLVVLSTIAVFAGEMLLARKSFAAALTSESVLAMSTVSLVVGGCIVLAAYERWRFGSYTEMLREYFGRN